MYYPRRYSFYTPWRRAYFQDLSSSFAPLLTWYWCWIRFRRNAQLFNYRCICSCVHMSVFASLTVTHHVESISVNSTAILLLPQYSRVRYFWPEIETFTNNADQALVSCLSTGLFYIQYITLFFLELANLPYIAMHIRHHGAHSHCAILTHWLPFPFL